MVLAHHTRRLIATRVLIRRIKVGNLWNHGDIFICPEPAQEQIWPICWILFSIMSLLCRSNQFIMLKFLGPRWADGENLEQGYIHSTKTTTIYSENGHLTVKRPNGLITVYVVVIRWTSVKHSPKCRYNFSLSESFEYFSHSGPILKLINYLILSTLLPAPSSSRRKEEKKTMASDVKSDPFPSRDNFPFGMRGMVSAIL